MKVKRIDTDYRELNKKRQEQRQKQKEYEFKKLFEEHRERLKQEEKKPFTRLNGSGARYYSKLCKQMFGKWGETKYDWGK